MEIKIKILMPDMPDHVIVEGKPGRRQDGIDFNANKLPLIELTREQAEEYAEEWKQAFIRHWVRLKNDA